MSGCYSRATLDREVMGVHIDHPYAEVMFSAPNIFGSAVLHSE